MTVESLATATASANATVAEPFVQPLLLQLGFNHAVMRINLAGVAHEESLRTPGVGGNCLNWVVGHVVSARQSWLEAVLHEQPVIDPKRLAAYRRGSSPLQDGPQVVRLEELLAAFDAAQAPLLAAMARLTPQRMAQAAPFSPGNDPTETVASLVAKLVYHEAYHTGQTGLLRRVLGHPGGIA